MALKLSDDYANHLLSNMFKGVGTMGSGVSLGMLNNSAPASLTLSLYTGSPPSSANSAPTGTLLFQGAITNTSGFGTGIAFTPPVSGTVKSRPCVSAANPSASGTAGYFRIDGYSVPIGQGTVTAAGGGGDMILSSVSLTTSAAFTISEYNFNVAATSGNVKMNTKLRNWLVTMLSSNEEAALPETLSWYGASGIFIYSGSAPASADIPATGTLLAEADYTGGSCTDMSIPSAAVIAITPVPITAAGTGTIGYVRVVIDSGSGVPYVLQFSSVGTTSSSDVVFDTLSLTSGSGFTLNALSLGL